MKSSLACAVWLLVSILSTAQEFPQLYNSEQDKSEPTSAHDALTSITMPDGFRATLFASEPEVQNPIAMSFDGRGRLWIAENYTYAERALRFDMKLKDRIVIFEDKDNDGKADSRIVFDDSLQMLTGLTVGLGGVWAMCSPQLLFIPDRNQDDKPDGPAEVVLDGFTVAQENYHNFANGLKFGPDGWLYGRCGASCPGQVGVPTTKPENRIPIVGGLWRYHPTKQIFEALTHGTTNPWGHDWNAHGEPFFINTVNGHLWHAITGAHFMRPHTVDANPHAYRLIDQHADHWHFDTGKGWTASRDGAANDFGGGHAHIGEMIYQGGSWPAQYHGKLFTMNMHGRRLNLERLDREGSGYVGRHEPDMMLFGDTWFRGIDLDYGPDGNVFVIDWSDTGECHESTGVHRTSGRIYKFIYGAEANAKNSRVNFSELSPQELASLHNHANEWFVRKARLQLQQRSLEGTDVSDATMLLSQQLDSGRDSVSRLRALWTLWTMGDLEDAKLFELLSDNDEHLRAWAIRLLSDSWPLDNADGMRPIRWEAAPDKHLLDIFTSIAAKDASALVRLSLATVLNRLPVASRNGLGKALASRTEDAQDHNLPLMVWYGLTPLADVNSIALVEIAKSSSWPTLRQLIARRLGEEIEKHPDAINSLFEVASRGSKDFREDLLVGLDESLAGWHRAPKPAAWDRFVLRAAEDGSEQQISRIRELNVLFGDGRAVDELKSIVRNQNADITARKAALQSLVDTRAPGLKSMCEELLRTRFLNSVAARGLALEEDALLGEKMVKAYRTFAALERPQLVSILATRVPWAQALLTAVESEQIPRDEITAFHARQIRNLDDASLSDQLASVWGQLRDSPEDKRQLIAQLKERLTTVTLARADLGNGRAMYKKTCASCHILFGDGGKIGPDLTGAQRQNFDYLAENIVDPSAVVTADYRVSILQLLDGRVLTGIISERTGKTLTLKTQNETLTINLDDIEITRNSTVSLMADGLLQPLSGAETRDLFAYLMSLRQVDLPAITTTEGQSGQ